MKLSAITIVTVRGSAAAPPLWSSGRHTLWTKGNFWSQGLCIQFVKIGNSTISLTETELFSYSQLLPTTILTPGHTKTFASTSSRASHLMSRSMDLSGGGKPGSGGKGGTEGKGGMGGRGGHAGCYLCTHT